jgi:YD repeat-containing protein
MGILDPKPPTRTELSATYASAFADAQSITYNPDGTVATVTENGVTTSYTYNTDGTVATDTRTVNGVTTTRNYGYTSGNLTSITKAA